MLLASHLWLISFLLAYFLAQSDEGDGDSTFVIFDINRQMDTEFFQFRAKRLTSDSQ